LLAELPAPDAALEALDDILDFRNLGGPAK
jgi:hypothetical protein